MDIWKKERLACSGHYYFTRVSLCTLLVLFVWFGMGTDESAANESDYVYRTIPGGVEITNYNGSETELVIPETLGGQPVVSIQYSAFSNKQLSSVVLPDPLVSIHDAAFQNNKLTSVTIGKHVTSFGLYVFSENPLAQLIVHPDNPSFKDILGEGLYSKDGKRLIHGTMSGAIATGTEVIQRYAFYGMGLDHVSFPNSVTTLERSAFGNNRLETIHIPDHVTSVDSFAFSENQLTSVVIGAGLTSIEDFVFEDNQLTSVHIPEGITSIGLAAFAENQLTSVSFPASLESVDNGAFSGNQLTSVFIPRTLTHLGTRVFSNNPLTQITVDGAHVNYMDINQKGIYTKDGKNLIQGTMSGEIAPGTEVITAGALLGMRLEEIILPDSVSQIGNLAFMDNQLTHIQIPDQVTDIRLSAFKNNQLTSVVFGVNVTNIREEAFANNLLENITIGENVNVLESSAFNHNPLKQITVETDNPTYQDIDGQGLYSIDGRTLIIGTSSGVIAPGTVEIGVNSFTGRGLDQITIPDGVATIKSRAFWDNPLTAIVIPVTVTTIESGAFFPIPANLTIIGEAGSEAETYAIANSIRFLDFSKPFALEYDPYDSDDHWGPEAKTRVTAYGVAPLDMQYIWSTETTVPPISADWIPLVNGDEISQVKDGKWHLYIYAKDGRHDDWFASSGIFLVDQSSPTLDIRMKQGEHDKHYTDGSWTNQQVSVSIQAKDAHMQELRVKIQHDGTEEEIIVEESEDYLLERLFTNNGIYQLDVSATDEAGQITRTQRTIKISKNGLRVESTLKHSDDSAYVSGQWTSQNVTVSVDVYQTQGLAVTSSVYYSMDRGANWYAYSTPLTFTEDGRHDLWFEAVDEAGNKLQDALSILIDKTTPEIQLSPNGSDPVTPQSEVSSMVTVSDASSGVDLSSLTFTWSTDQTQLDDHVSWQTFQNGDNLSHTGKTGIYYLHIRAADLAGNIRYFISDPFHLDDAMEHNALLHALYVDVESVPAFDPHVFVYTMNVEYSRTHVTVTPTAQADASALSVRVNAGPFQAVPSGTSSDPLPLKVGTNVVDIQVVASDKLTANTYTIHVVRKPARRGGGGGYTPSSNASLSDLVLSEARLTPEFAEDITAYTAEVANDVDRLTLSVSRAYHAATIEVNGEAISDDQELIDIPLVEGTNTIQIVVTAEDGTQQTYTVTVERESARSEEPEAPQRSFTDISGHWAEAFIQEAVEKQIVSGYPDDTFKPNRATTRAEFIVMLAGVLKLEGEGNINAFTDQDEIGLWARRAVSQAVKAGIIEGYADGSFRPEAHITRAEAAAMIARASRLSFDLDSRTVFADDADIPNWAKGAVEAIRKLGIISGRADNRFVPNDTATRAEMIVMLLKMLEQQQ